MLCGEGEVLALDKRYPKLALNGLRGLLPSASYISELSGGAWLLGTFVPNDWMSVAAS